MKIASFKLLTGEELIAEIKTESDTHYEVKSPLIVHMMRTPGGPSLGFAQWSMIQQSVSLMQLYKHALCGSAIEVIPEVAHSYEEQVTGLALPPPVTASSILLG